MSKTPEHYSTKPYLAFSLEYTDICALEDGEYVAEKYKEKLGKVSVGKSCIRFKKLEDLNIEQLKTIIKKASNNPGLIKS